MKVKPLHTSWKAKMKRKADDKHVKAKQSEIRDALKAERDENTQKRKEREEHRQKNIEKSEIVQIIKWVCLIPLNPLILPISSGTLISSSI